MKLIDILKELNTPRDFSKPITIDDLTPEEREELFKKGSLLVKLPPDPSRPETVGSQVINLPKIDQVKRGIIQNKKEFDIFTFSQNSEIQSVAKEINKLHNQLFRAMNALDKLLQLQKQGRI